MKRKILNIIDFCFIFNTDIDHHPSYIREKWDKILGVDVLYKEYRQTQEELDWIKKWNVSNRDDMMLFNITYNLNSIINNGGLVSSLLLYLEEYIDIGFINDNEYNHIHFLLKKHIDVFINIKRVSRDIKLTNIIHSLDIK